VHNIIESLKKKGPGGVPIWGYAVGTAIVLYFGYRWFSNRSGGSSSSQDQADNSVDTSGGGFATPGLGGSTDPGQIDTTPPDSTQDTNPVSGDSTGIINGPANIGEPPPAKKKKAHKGPHDHKQGVPHTRKKAIHRRKPGHKQTPHAHAPKGNKRPTSHEKAKTTRAVPSAASKDARRIRAVTPPPISPKVKVLKTPPPPVKRLPEEPLVVAKAPPKTSAAKRKR
jgi:hypothetical protein